MGGPGSGRWYRWNRKDTVEEHHALDIRTWQRRGWLRPGTSISWSGAMVQVQPGGPTCPLASAEQWRRAKTSASPFR